MRLKFVVVSAAFAALIPAVPAGAQTVPGTMRCSVKGSFGFLIASDHAVTCVYRRVGVPAEFYTGSTGNLGFDLGPTNAYVITYRVGPAPIVPGVLQGTFAGPGFGIAGGPGASSNTLIGPGGVTLFRIPDPSTPAYTGVVISVGLNNLNLTYVDVDHIPAHHRDRRLLRRYGINEAD